MFDWRKEKQISDIPRVDHIQYKIVVQHYSKSLENKVRESIIKDPLSTFLREQLRIIYV